jgi:hypothetical protein
LDAGMTNWGSLQTAYGSAEGIPALLVKAAAMGSGDHELWNELYGHLCHQGTVYSASYAALPALAQMSVQHEPGVDLGALDLGAAIIASKDGPEDRAVVRRRYGREIAEFHAVAERNLQHARDDMYFVYGLQALMAFEDGGVWQSDLEYLVNGEAALQCPSCDEDLLVDLDSPEPQLTSSSDDLGPRAVAPVEPRASTVEGRLLALARSNNRPAVAAKLTFFFGTTVCPECDEPFSIPSALG